MEVGCHTYGHRQSDIPEKPIEHAIGVGVQFSAAVRLARLLQLVLLLVQKLLQNRHLTPFVAFFSEGYSAVLGRRQQHDVPYRPNEYDPAKSPIRPEPMEIVFQQSQYILF
jgi:hypothetical protein